MLFQFEVTRFPYNNNSPSSSREVDVRTYYLTPLPECEQLNFFFSSSSSWHSLCFGSFAREIRFKKALDFGWTGALFSPIFDFPAIFFLFCRFDFIFRHFYFNHGRTSRKQQRQQRHHQQQLRKRESERAARRTFVRKKKVSEFSKESARARIFVDKDLDI